MLKEERRTCAKRCTCLDELQPSVNQRFCSTLWLDKSNQRQEEASTNPGYLKCAKSRNLLVSTENRYELAARNWEEAVHSTSGGVASERTRNVVMSDEAQRNRVRICASERYLTPSDVSQFLGRKQEVGATFVTCVQA